MILSALRGRPYEWGIDHINHEWGHLMQERILGPLYIPKIAIPSVLSLLLDPDNHDSRWFERNADWLAELFGAGQDGCICNQ